MDELFSQSEPCPVRNRATRGPTSPSIKSSSAESETNRLSKMTWKCILEHLGLSRLVCLCGGNFWRSDLQEAGYIACIKFSFLSSLFHLSSTFSVFSRFLPPSSPPLFYPFFLLSFLPSPPFSSPFVSGLRDYDGERDWETSRLCLC